MYEFYLNENGYPPAIIRKEKRKEYYMALEADKGNLEPFIQMVGDEVKHNLELIVFG